MDAPNTITNEMLYSLIREKFELVDKQFAQINREMELMREQHKREMDQMKEQNKREFDLIREQIKQVKDQQAKDMDIIHDYQREEGKKLEKVYESRDRVTVNFTRSWAFASIFIALLSSMLVFVFDRAF